MSNFRTIEIADSRFTNDGLLPVTFKSSAIRGRADVTLFLPSAARELSDVPLVLLLHGVYGSHWAWSLSGGAHRTATRMIDAGEIPPIALAMPSDGLWGDGSGYVRHSDGADYERYIVDEVPACARKVLDAAVSPKSPLFIAGLSMGGFGALRLGAKYPTRFQGISGHSSITHFSQMTKFVEEPLSRYGPPPETEQSVLHAMQANRAQLPPVRFDCGTEDLQIEENRTLHRDLDARGIPHVYEEFPGGHEWPYWERHLADTLRFFTKALR
jgi:S-formylglutathione hydrolase FrmB